MLGYRMLFTVPAPTPGEVTTLAMEQLHAWLREKGYAADALAAGETVSLATGVVGNAPEARGAGWIRRYTNPDRREQPPWAMDERTYGPCARIARQASVGVAGHRCTRFRPG